MTARRRGRLSVLLAALPLLLAACMPAPPSGTPATSSAVRSTTHTTAHTTRPAAVPSSASRVAATLTTQASSAPIGSSIPAPTSASTPPTSTAPRPPGTFTFAFAGDVNFAERTLARLADPATAFGVATGQVDQADLTMVNLETAITTGGSAQDKSFTFRAPPSALVALHDAGVDLATMANNHGADYGLAGLQDSLAAIKAGPLPVIGLGANADAAYAPFETTVNGVRVAVFAATQVHDETLEKWTAGTSTPGVASAFSDRLIAGVKAAKAAGYVVVTYIHWGTEYVSCPNSEQTTLADQLAQAGASAVIGTHAHVLQGAGWRSDGVYVAYGLSNYLWWRSFGNEQDDNGVLTLTFASGKVTGAQFAPSHLDDSGIPVPATGDTRTRILAEWDRDRACADLSASPSR